MNKQYKAQLEQIIKSLSECEIEVHAMMVNLMMKRELSEWSEGTPIDDVIEIDYTLLEASEDSNVQDLIKLHKILVEIKEKCVAQL